MHLHKRLIPQKSTKQLSVVDKCQSMEMEDDHWKDAKKRGSKVLVLFRGKRGRGGERERGRERESKEFGKRYHLYFAHQVLHEFQIEIKEVNILSFRIFFHHPFLVLLFCFFFFIFINVVELNKIYKVSLILKQLTKISNSVVRF